MGLYRSEKMKLYQLTVPKDDVESAMNKIGDIGHMHFIDLNKEGSAFHLPYTGQIKKIEVSSKQLDYLEEQCKKFYIKLTKPKNIDGFLSQLTKISSSKKKALNLLLDEIIRDISDQEGFIKQQNAQVKEAEQQLQYLVDCVIVYKADQKHMPRLEQKYKAIAGDLESESVGLMASMSAESNLHKIAGVITKPEVERLRRLIFRTTKGKSFLFIEDYHSDQMIQDKDQKCIYIIMYWNGASLREKIGKICDSFTGQRFEIPSPHEVDQRIRTMTTSIDDARNVLKQTRMSVNQQLNHFNQSIEGNNGSEHISTLYIYKMFLAKENALYRNLNMLKLQNNVFIGYYWAPADEQSNITAALNQQRSVKVQVYENHNITRPTLIKTNECTEVFQLIVDTYGVPKYQEANPATVSIVTFPFFFGMMFGDMGHGSLVFVFATILCLFKNKLIDGPMGMFVKIRHMLLLMGMMSAYSGLIYNEFFAIPMNIFGSCYKLNTVERKNPTGEAWAKDQTMMMRRSNSTCVYPWGQDPVWSIASNKLSFVNSVKMKMSVIFGVIHMTFGILMKGTNKLYYCQCMELLTEVFAGLVILGGMFGWMDALILKKFFMTVDIDDCSNTGAGVSARCIGDLNNEKLPGIISVMITTVFAFGNYDQKHPHQPIIGATEEDQYRYSFRLLMCSIAFMPVMLFTKPCLFLMSSKKQMRIDSHGCEQVEMVKVQDQTSQQYKELDDDGNDNGAIKDQDKQIVVEKQSDVQYQRTQKQYQEINQTLLDMDDKGHNDTFGGIFIHQMIETIEFVLGTVSNTASYLRLWALSLAHTQLADTFFKLPFAPQVIGAEFPGLAIIKGVIFWPILWTITFGVLMCMDLLECFLHTLRLHWVEFQNKFYCGDGYKFKPFSFNTVLDTTLKSSQ